MQANEKIDSYERLIDSLELRGHYNACYGDNTHPQAIKDVLFSNYLDVRLPAVHCMNMQENWGQAVCEFMDKTGKLLITTQTEDGTKCEWKVMPPPLGADELFFAGRVPTEDNYWVWREAYRFRKNIYKRPQVHEILNKHKPELWFHFAHASVEEPHMIAYTPNHEYGKRDRQVRVKLGRYLQQFFGDVLSPEDIRAAVNNCKPYEISWATTGDEMEYVYVRGPNSCMGGSDGFDSDVHPVRVYEGEFKLAYIQLGDGSITARCFVHEPTKTWVRSYGDDGPVLSDMLENLGYSKASSWVGAKLKIIRQYDDYVAPYLDGDAKGIETFDSKHWIVCEGSGEYWLDNTNGLTQPSGEACGDCGERHHDEDNYWSEYHEHTIGPCCIDNYRMAVFTRRGSETYVHDDQVIYCESNDTFYLDDHEVLSAHDIMQCADDDNYYHLDDMVETVDGEWVHVDNALECGEDDNGDTVYCRSCDVGKDWFAHCTIENVKFISPDHVPESVRDEYTEEDDDGNTIELPMLTVEQFVHSGKYKQYQCGFDWNMRNTFERWDKNYQARLAEVAL